MLKNNWVDKNKKIAFSGVTKIFEHYKGKYSQKEIEKDLAEIPTYTRHKEGKKVKNFNPFFVYEKNELWQVDLMYLPDLAEDNDGFKYLMCVIDTFSRKMEISPLKRKNASTVTNAFHEIHTKFNATPQKIYADNGGEFKCKSFEDYCSKNRIRLFFSSNETKAAHVERAQRSFQGILYRMMEELQTKSYLNILDDVLNVYNNRVNRMIDMSPNEAFKEKNKEKVLSKLNEYYNSHVLKKKSPKFKKGDAVRVKENRTKFSRGYHPYFSEEVFKIHKVHINLPYPRYELSTFNGSEIIKGTFYEAELTKASHQIFKIEKILKERKKQGKTEYFVKWMGYPDSENSWVESSLITRYN